MDFELKEFKFEERIQPVVYKETVSVNPDVDCDVYGFEGDDEKDLGIIKIKVGGKTPLQKVLKGQRTVEGHVSGQGKLVITRVDGKEETYKVSDTDSAKFKIDVGIGERMQWKADPDSKLVAFEVCIPPYEDGRFENL